MLEVKRRSLSQASSSKKASSRPNRRMLDAGFSTGSSTTSTGSTITFTISLTISTGSEDGKARCFGAEGGPEAASPPALLAVPTVLYGVLRSSGNLLRYFAPVIYVYVVKKKKKKEYEG